MEKSNKSAEAGELPSSGGGSPAPGTSSDDKPIGTFGPNAGGTPPVGSASSDATVNFRCKLTLKNGATLFGGAVVGGKLVGSGDGDLVLELEGSATVSGGENLFGGAVVGGRLVGGGDESGSGGKQRQSYSRQSQDAGEGGGHSAAD